MRTPFPRNGGGGRCGRCGGRHEAIRRLIVIDGAGYIFRAFYALPPMTRRADGAPVNAVYGFTRMLKALVENVLREDESGETAIAVAFDVARRSFRNDLYKDYKANRAELPEALKPQFAPVRACVRAFNLPIIEREGFEADDLIATCVRLARPRGIPVTVYSSDKDLMQLIGAGVDMYDPMKKRAIGTKEVEEKFGVPPSLLGDLLALAGDASDNVPGVPGIGVKTAATLLNRFGSLEALLAQTEKVERPKLRQALATHGEQARLSRKLVRLRCDVQPSFDLAELAFKPYRPETLLAFLDDWEFVSIAREIRSAVDGEGPRAASIPAAFEAPLAILTQVSEVSAWVRQARRGGRCFFALEAEGEEPLRATPQCLALTADLKKIVCLPLTSDGADDSAQARLSALAPLLSDDGVLKIGHDIKRAMLILGRHGLDDTTWNAADDLALMSYCVQDGHPDHGLCAIGRRYNLPPPPAEDEEGAEEAKDGDGGGSFDPKAVRRAVKRLSELSALHARLARSLAENGVASLYYAMERPLLSVLAAMERHGIGIDVSVLDTLGERLDVELSRLEKDIHGLAGREFAIASPKQLARVLFDDLGLPSGRKGKSGERSTGADILEGLSASGHMLPEKVLSWRKLSKLRGTYTEALSRRVDAQDKRLHTSFAMTVTNTGRLSSLNPNLQNIPVRSVEGRAIRSAFRAARGHVLLSLDYSQIELRLLAHIAGIDALKDAFARSEDIHAATAARMFGLASGEVGAHHRRQAKTINFGMIYGISAFGLARRLGIEQKEAQEAMDAFFRHYPGIHDYMERSIALCRKRGYVETLFKRRCYFPDIQHKNPNIRHYAERACINAPIQGSAADIIKRAMVRIHKRLGKEGLRARMVLQVHDELLFEVPRGEEGRVAELAMGLMRDAPLPYVRLASPLVVERGVGANWAEAHA